MIPVFLLTGFFRMSTLSLCLAWDGVAFATIFLPFALILPLVVLLLLKIFGKLPHLSVADLGQGAIGELTSIVLWGNTGREGSRVIQAVVGGYFLILYSITVSVLDSTKVLALPLQTRFIRQGGYNIPPKFIASTIFSGVVGYVLFLFQIFWFDKISCDWRKKIDNLGSGLAGH